MAEAGSAVVVSMQVYVSMTCFSDMMGLVSPRVAVNACSCELWSCKSGVTNLSAIIGTYVHWLNTLFFLPSCVTYGVATSGCCCCSCCIEGMHYRNTRRLTYIYILIACIDIRASLVSHSISQGFILLVNNPHLSSKETTVIQRAILETCQHEDTCQHEESHAMFDPVAFLGGVCVVGLLPVGLAQGQPSQF